jgi:mono/diheme cytochrome c family protein
MKLIRPTLTLLAATSFAVAAERIDYNRDIRPILSNGCILCHGPDEEDRKGGPKGSGGLRFDTEEGSRLMLSSGKMAISPGKPEASEALARMMSQDPDEVMPPKKHGKQLSEKEVGLIRQWITEGASYAKHWSYQKPSLPTPPAGAAHPVDAFVRERLRRESLSPNAEADKATLARRAALDITGLPPKHADLQSFLQDSSPNAFESYVDRLLASPQYGEHWAREWLDLARYADSAGYADDPMRTIWPYRDYVIRSFNANKPFDRFTIEQIAGDLLPQPTDEQLVATAFHRNTMTNSEGGTNDEEFRSAAIVDRVNTTFGVWMGTSMACAQCHTHKYDPITQKEYFQIYAYFNNTADADRKDEAPLHSVYTPEQQAQRRELQQKLAKQQASFQTPTPSQIEAAKVWFQGLSSSTSSVTLVPAKATSHAKHELKIAEDGTVSSAQKAPNDTYKLTIPISTPLELHGVELQVPEGQENFVLTGISASVEPPSGQPGPQAKYVRISLPGKDALLQLAEVQVFSQGKNMALTGNATQSSTYSDAKANLARDGNTDGKYEGGSVAHTNLGDAAPWWEVDLFSTVPIDQIVVWNRTEAAERLAGFHIQALDEKRNVVWERKDNPAQVSTKFDLSGQQQLDFTAAVATHSQDGYPASSLVDRQLSTEKRKKSGWAVAPYQNSAQTLLTSLAKPMQLAPGSTLHVRLEHDSPVKSHVLQRFRIAAATDALGQQRLELPKALQNLLAKSEQTAADVEVIAQHYARHLAPDLAAERTKLKQLEGQLEAISPTTVPIQQELPADKRRTTKVQLRGNYQALGDTVAEGVPVAFHPLPQASKPDRLALANWLVSPENPLTARVLVNRYWENIFGIGLVRTSEEFGSQGEMPSHPELLDWLANEVIRTGWDLKQLIRLLVTSASYRQSSKVDQALLERDPDNRLLARGPRFRLSGEMVRDQALAVSGLLSEKMFGRSVRPERPNMGLSAAFGGGLDWATSSGEDRFRRGLYTEWRRTSPYPSLATFDAPNREVCTIKRSRTNTPLQAFVTLNDPVFVEASQALARRLVKLPSNERLNTAFWEVLSRPPTAKEGARMSALLEQTTATYTADPKLAEDMATKPIGPLPENTNAVELAAWTALANVMLNLDETLMKR